MCSRQSTAAETNRVSAPSSNQAVIDALLAEYRQQLDAQRQQIEHQYQQIVALQTIIQTLAEQQSPKYDLRGAQFSGGFAETVQGNQQSGQLNPHTN